MALIIKADGTTLEVEPKNEKDFQLDELQEIVGGYIEVIYLPNKMILVIDEEGKLKNKPYNEIATSYCPKLFPDYIVGDTLYCKQKQVK